ncbi:MAG: hypothetical protein D3908_10225, partial [Candidatus Electrothrix sp. AUS4]|nr:hypothetical protein [Candidatus Electrothrix sp. AUS4]
MKVSLVGFHRALSYKKKIWLFKTVMDCLTSLFSFLFPRKASEHKVTPCPPKKDIIGVQTGIQREKP